MSNGVLTLRAGALAVDLSPSVGGSISRFRRIGPEGAVEILRGCNSCSKNVLEAASFPLIPFVNRVRGGQFRFRGRDVRLKPNMAGDPSPLHGQGWLGAWRVEQAEGAMAVLSFHHPAGEWPWAYEGTQRFDLDESGLSVLLSCRNLGDEPMPCGLGHHPYFRCSATTRIDTDVRHAWTIDEYVLPVARVNATGPFCLRDRKVCGQGLDHGFGGWGGTARLTDPNWPFALRLSSRTARFFQLYSPAEGGIFVAEPVSHANAALNAPEAEWPDLGLRVLEPQEQMSIDMRIDVIPAGARPSG